ncbi:MAG: putative Fe-S cluster assembly protein SufT [Candidatus Binatia bacterium]
MQHEEIELTRDCQAEQIPLGTIVTIPQGTAAVITQSLGDTYTVRLPNGGLYRIAGQDADALGKNQQSAAPISPPHAGPVTEDLVWAQLKDVYDPEIPINVVDLGLIYDLQIEPQPDGESKVFVQMTLTAQGCGMGPSIAGDAQRRIEILPGVAEAEVRVVWDPPWHPDMMSPEGKKKLGVE